MRRRDRKVPVKLARGDLSSDLTGGVLGALNADVDVTWPEPAGTLDDPFAAVEEAPLMDGADVVPVVDLLRASGIREIDWGCSWQQPFNWCASPPID